MIIEEKENTIIKTNHFITIYLMVNENIKKIYIFQLPKELESSIVVNI